MTDKDAMLALMARYCDLGRLLPQPDDLDTDDAAALAETKIVLAEMQETKAKIDALLNSMRKATLDAEKSAERGAT
jgi:hypothetical protein